eukprot:CAMPEP_0197072874 /NCGR_PEP_ID=MMETSP1384-20130603/210317_1 /TAXON_ID=29189 /ORGANISM="Ammonia sp." /LENGTH=325 /DNA_ID=CAMNT_0042511695 /DNA_START=104 /DNA_END=1077 /DNA_ORIENTATION=-
MSSLVSSLPVADQSTLNLGHIDSRTKNIVYGYIGRIQSLLLLDDYEEDEINRHIPRSVYLFCVELVDDHFMIQQTTKQWTFRGPSLNRMLHAVNGQPIETELFDACKMQWKVQIYPNGYSSSHVGEFQLYLCNMDLPSLWDTVTIRLTVHIQQLSVNFTHIKRFSKGSEWSWGTESFSFQEFTNLNPDRSTAVNGQPIETELFDACKMQWKVQIYPNGYISSHVGEFRLYLCNMDLPSLWDTVTIRLTVHIQQLSVTFTHIQRFSKGSDRSWGTESFSFQEFTNLNPDQLTVTVTLRVLQIKLKEDDDSDDGQTNAVLYQHQQPV